MTNLILPKNVCHIYFKEATGDKISDLFCYEVLQVTTLFRDCTLNKCRISAIIVNHYSYLIIINLTKQLIFDLSYLIIPGSFCSSDNFCRFTFKKKLNSEIMDFRYHRFPDYVCSINNIFI